VVVVVELEPGGAEPTVPGDVLVVVEQEKHPVVRVSDPTTIAQNRNLSIELFGLRALFVSPCIVYIFFSSGLNVHRWPSTHRSNWQSLSSQSLLVSCLSELLYFQTTQRQFVLFFKFPKNLTKEGRLYAVLGLANCVLPVRPREVGKF